jgi:hypothetical protein
LKEAMTRLVGLPTGAVRKVYTVDGKQVPTLESFVDGGRYICTGAEALNVSLMPTAAKKEKETAEEKREEAEEKEIEKEIAAEQNAE